MLAREDDLKLHHTTLMADPRGLSKVSSFTPSGYPFTIVSNLGFGIRDLHNWRNKYLFIFSAIFALVKGFY